MGMPRTRLPKGYKHEPEVYVIACMDMLTPLVKIGCTTNLIRRIAQHRQEMSTYGASFVGFMGVLDGEDDDGPLPGDMLEPAIHELLNEDRVSIGGRTEFFRLGDKTLEWINGIQLLDVPERELSEWALEYLPSETAERWQCERYTDRQTV